LWGGRKALCGKKSRLANKGKGKQCSLGGEGEGTCAVPYVSLCITSFLAGMVCGFRESKKQGDLEANGGSSGETGRKFSRTEEECGIEIARRLAAAESRGKVKAVQYSQGATCLGGIGPSSFMYVKDWEKEPEHRRRRSERGGCRRKTSEKRARRAVELRFSSGRKRSKNDSICGGQPKEPGFTLIIAQIIDIKGNR